MRWPLAWRSDHDKVSRSFHETAQELFEARNTLRDTRRLYADARLEIDELKEENHNLRKSLGDMQLHGALGAYYKGLVDIFQDIISSENHVEPSPGILPNCS
jgi:hypothetical protein